MSLTKEEFLKKMAEGRAKAKKVREAKAKAGGNGHIDDGAEQIATKILENAGKKLDELKGARSSIDEERREDGVIAREVARGRGATSVLQRSMTAVDDSDYRQILLTGFTDPREAALATAAIAECRRFGVPETDIIDRIHAMASVRVSNRLMEIFRALTSSTYNINSRGKQGNKFPWWNKREDSQGGTDEGDVWPSQQR